MREYKIMHNAIEKFALNLEGKTVFTEAASNAFLWTPIIAALAGAKQVFAVSQSSSYGNFEEIVTETMQHAQNLQVENKIIISREKKPTHIAKSDLVTNLGFVRPLNKEFVDCLHPGAVICLMWEPWEFRSEDIDLKACQHKGIPILGTNESDPRLQTYQYVAMTVVKLLLENSIEIFDTDLLILGSGHFLNPTAQTLRKLGARVFINKMDPQTSPECIICLEHHKDDCLIGENGVFPLSGGKNSPLIIHLCGNVDHEFIKSTGASLVPPSPATCGIMSFTTGHVGPKPVIDLHTAGLKVGQAYLDQNKDELKRLAKPLSQSTTTGKK